MLSFISAVRLIKRTNEILLDGYKKVRALASEIHTHPSRVLQYPIFKIPTIDRWIIVVSGKYTEELHRAPDDVLSLNEALNTVGLSCLTSNTY